MDFALKTVESILGSGYIDIELEMKEITVRYDVGLSDSDVRIFNDNQS